MGGTPSPFEMLQSPSRGVEELGGSCVAFLDRLTKMQRCCGDLQLCRKVLRGPSRSRLSLPIPGAFCHLSKDHLLHPTPLQPAPRTRGRHGKELWLGSEGKHCSKKGAEERVEWPGWDGCTGRPRLQFLIAETAGRVTAELRGTLGNLLMGSSLGDPVFSLI